MKWIAFLAVTGICVVFAHTALAADLGVRAAAPPPAPIAVAPTWTGFYAGVNGGWGWTDFHTSQTPFGATAIADIGGSFSNRSSIDGGVAGGQLGYNWQAGNWVFGVEGDFDGASISGAQTGVFPSLLGGPGATNGFEVYGNINWLASIRGRLGYTWGPQLSSRRLRLETSRPPKADT